MNKLMKFGFAVLTVVFSLASCSETTAQSKESVQEVAKSVEMSMSIEGMTCAMGCARAIEVELKNLEGVEDALVNFEASNATVKYNTAITSEANIVAFVNEYRNGSFKAKALATKCGDASKKGCCAKKKSCTSEEKAKCESSKKSCDKASKDGESCCASKKKACTAEEKAKCEAAKKSCDKASKDGESCCASKKKACTAEEKAKCEAAKKACHKDSKEGKSCSKGEKAKCEKSAKKSCGSADKDSKNLVALQRKVLNTQVLV